MSSAASWRSSTRRPTSARTSPTRASSRSSRARSAEALRHRRRRAGARAAAASLPRRRRGARWRVRGLFRRAADRLRRRRGGGRARRLGGRVARVPPRRRDRAAVGRAAVGIGAGRRDPRRHRSRPRVRHRRPSDDTALPRAPAGGSAHESARRRLRLGGALDRRGEARLQAGRRVRPRRGGDGDSRGERRGERRSRRSPRSATAGGARRHEHRARRGRRPIAQAAGGTRDRFRLSRPRRATRDRMATHRAPRPRRMGRGPARIPPVTTFSVQFLGCKVSHVDAHEVREALLGSGHVEREDAEVAVINTCCVTHEAVAKSRKAAARAARTHRRVYVTGCGANLGAAAFAGLPDNVVVVAKRSEETPEFVAGDVGAIGCVQADARLDRVRAFVKVQDGCSFSCNFCVIPLVRGRSRSRPARAVLAEIARRVAQGHREVVLTGINLGCYRDRDAGYRLPRLVREAGAVPGLARLRLSSIEVNHLDEELLAALRETPAVSRHLHVPLQSGDDAVLRAMRRRYSTSTFLRRLAPLQQEFNLTSDVIVGFPTEDEQAFANTVRVTREAGLTKLHVFPYSPRPGTVTEGEDPVTSAVKRERSARLRALSDEACAARWATKVGRDDVVLVDRPGRGYGDDYSPWLVNAPVGELVRVRGAAVTQEGIRAA